MRISSALLAAAATLAIGAPALASTTIQFSNIRAEWFDVMGGLNVNTSGQGTSSAQVRWGIGDNQSGYRFDAIGIPELVVDPLTQTSAVTNIGQFTHLNFPINSGSSITGVKLRFTTDVLVNDVAFQNIEFIYAFDHFETPNGENPCADGGANGVGVNVNGCADRVSVNFNQQSGFFTIDDVEYALDVRGFLVGNEPANLFWTQEGVSNSAFLRGQVVLRSTAGAVPEPATWAMLITGFGLVGAAARRRQSTLSQVAG